MPRCSTPMRASASIAYAALASRRGGIIVPSAPWLGASAAKLNTVGSPPTPACRKTRQGRAALQELASRLGESDVLGFGGRVLARRMRKAAERDRAEQHDKNRRERRKAPPARLGVECGGVGMNLFVAHGSSPRRRQIANHIMTENSPCACDLGHSIDEGGFARDDGARRRAHQP